MTGSLIILGASNVTRGMASLIGAARSILGGPMNLYIAAGHGRSFGTHSRVLCRELPAIVECGLWDALARSPRPVGERSGVRVYAGRTAPSTHCDSTRALTPSLSQGERVHRFALITDIGNDIMYGQAPGSIMQWVETCVERLEAVGANIIITGLPLTTICQLSCTRFRVCKAILFPTRPLTFAQAMDRASELDQLLRDLAAKRGLPLIEPHAEWYGFDPVHPLRRHLREAWATYLQPWHSSSPRLSEEGSIRIVDRLRLRAALPQRFWIAGVPMGRAQPSARLSDGSILHTF